MSQRQVAQVTCPNCQEVGQFEIWNSVNVTFHPDLKEKILTMQLFQYHCDHCGIAVPVDYNFLYHDMANHLMLHYVAQSQSLEDEMKQYEATLSNLKEKDEETYERLLETEHRFVQGQANLIEKIQIFSAGYDDRVIEIQKTFLKASAPEQFETYQAFIFGEDVEGVPYFFLVKGPEDVSPFQFDTSLYDGIKRDYGHQFSQSDWVVDEDWAIDYLTDIEED